MRLSFIRQMVGTLSLVLLAVVTTHGSSMYTVTALGTLPGTSQSEAVGINASGQVIGVSYNTSPTAADAQSFLYNNGQMSAITPIGGGPAAAINDSGQVVGGQYNGINNAGAMIGGVNGNYALINGGQVTNTGLFVPFAISNSGVLGGYLFGQDTGTTSPAIFQNGIVQNLGPSLGITPSEGGDVQAINNSGQLLITDRITAVGQTPQTLLYNPATNSVTNITALVGNLGDHLEPMWGSATRSITMVKSSATDGSIIREWSQP